MRGALVVVGLGLWMVACDGGPSGANEPQSGTWSYDSTATPADDCGIVPVLELDGGEFELVNHGDGTLTIDDGDWVFDCTLVDGAFDCPDRFPGVDTVDGIEFVIEGTASGTFVGDDAGSGVQSGTADCEGADCDAAAQLMGISPPCSATVEFAMTFGS